MNVDINSNEDFIGSPGTGRIIPLPSMSATSQEELIALSKKTIAQGSKSFSFAAHFFDPREREGAWLLYSWCRLCDDAIDQSDSKLSAMKKLNWLESQTRIALHTSENLIHPAFEGLRILHRQYNLPPNLPLDLIQGMRMDVEGFRPQTIEDLGEYCYHVAGVVGLMMCYIMKVTDEKAQAHAVAFGNALQMTNIVRDIADDWKLERIYFPLEWLREMDIDSENFDHYQRHWPRLAKRLLREADARYEFGRKGLNYLPWKCRLAVRIAGRVYQEIGNQTKILGLFAWKSRVVVPHWKKLQIAMGECLAQAAEVITAWFKNKFASLAQKLGVL